MPRTGKSAIIGALIQFIARLAVFVVPAMAGATPAGAEEPLVPAVLSADELQTNFAGHAQFLLDEDWSLTVEAMALPQVAARFATVAGSGVDFGYTKSAIWLRFSVTNQTTTISDWRLFFRANFLQVFNVFQARPGGSMWLGKPRADCRRSP